MRDQIPAVGKKNKPGQENGGGGEKEKCAGPDEADLGFQPVEETIGIEGGDAEIEKVLASFLLRNWRSGFILRRSGNRAVAERSRDSDDLKKSQRASQLEKFLQVGFGERLGEFLLK